MDVYKDQLGVGLPQMLELKKDFKKSMQVGIGRPKWCIDGPDWIMCSYIYVADEGEIMFVASVCCEDHEKFWNHSPFFPLVWWSRYTSRELGNEIYLLKVFRELGAGA